MTDISQADLVGKFHSIVTKTEEQGERILREAGEMGARIMKDKIETKGTGKTWTGAPFRFPHAHPTRTASSPGRVASGTMLNAVNWQMLSKKAVEFGWTKQQLEYFLHQEYGIRTHNITGEAVEGMFALQDAFDETKHWMNREMLQLLEGKR